VRIEYSLTPLGRSLTAPLFALYEWMDARSDDVRSAREEYDRTKGQVEGFGEPNDPPRFSAPFQVRGMGTADHPAGRSQLRSLRS
jgi:hypothetical protein